jgi:hypothetical protein
MCNRQGCADCCPCSKSWLVAPARLVRFGQPMLRREDVAGSGRQWQAAVDARDATTISHHRHPPPSPSCHQRAGARVRGGEAVPVPMSRDLNGCSGHLNDHAYIPSVRMFRQLLSFLTHNLICCCYHAAPNCSFKAQTSTSTICPE